MQSQPQGSAWGLGVWPQPSPWADSTPCLGAEGGMEDQSGAPTQTPAPAASSSQLMAPGKPSEPRLEPEKRRLTEPSRAGLACSCTQQAVCKPRGLTRAAIPGRDLGVLEHEASCLPAQAPVC